MSNKIPIDLLKAIHSRPWAILPDYHDIIVGVASREIADIEAVLNKPAVKRDSGYLESRDGVGIINIGGVIAPYMNIVTMISGGTTIDQLALSFGEAMRSKDIKAIVLNIDSPGGDINGIHEFANMVYQARGQKPIVAYVSSMSASAAYWISSAADYVIADKTATLGSIGVVASWVTYEEKKGIKEYKLVSSQTPRKQQDLTSEEGISSIQAEIDGLANIFIESVALHRGFDAKHVENNFGKGGMLLSEDAISVGMADGLGSLEGVISSLQGGRSVITAPVKDVERTSAFPTEGRINAPSTDAGNIKNTKKGVSTMSNDEKIIRAVGRINASPTDEDEEKDKEEETKTKSEAEENEEKDKESKKKAEDDEEEKKKEDAKKQGLTDKRIQLMSTDPALYQSIKEVGVLEERERLSSIMEIAKVFGNTALVTKAMFDQPMTAKDLSFELITQENRHRAEYLQKYKEDALEIGNIKRSAGDVPVKDAALQAEVEDVKKGYNKR